MKANINGGMSSEQLAIRVLTIFAVGFLFVLLTPETAFAIPFGIPGVPAGKLPGAAVGGGGEGAMPWEGPLVKIQQALTGGAARALAIIAMAVAGGMLAFGGELSEFAKRICMVVIAAATMIGAANIINLAVPAAG